MKILILYNEIASYNIACFKELAIDHEVFLIKKEINQIEAPFKFNFDFPIKIYNSKDFNFSMLINLYKEINPEIIFCGGWINKDFINLCKIAKKSTKVLGFDNPYRSNLSQFFKSFIFKLYYKNVFNYSYVPGNIQHKLAIKMGFKNHQIIKGAYSCDFKFYNDLGKAFKKNKKLNYPKRFLFVGRYIKSKGILDLWKSFMNLHDKFPNDWELWCVGTGPLLKEKVVHPKIKHFGFIQPQDMSILIKNTSVFILPSYFEPWGVVVHEYASAGFPLVLSDKVNAGSVFLSNNINGYEFEARSSISLEKALKKIIDTNERDLIKMGEISIKLANKINPKVWADTLTSLKHNDLTLRI